MSSWKFPSGEHAKSNKNIIFRNEFLFKKETPMRSAFSFGKYTLRLCGYSEFRRDLRAPISCYLVKIIRLPLKRPGFTADGNQSN